MMPLSPANSEKRKSLHFIRVDGPDGDHIPLLVIPPYGLTETDGCSLANSFSDEFTTVVSMDSQPDSHEISDCVREMLRILAEQQIRRATVIGIGSGAAIAQAMAVIDPKFVRRLVLVNAQTSVEPKLFSRYIDWLERFLPLGLPLRPLSADFDSRPMLHRIRCPVLVVGERGMNQFLLSQSRLLVQKIPNAWLVFLEKQTGATGEGVTGHITLSLRSREFRSVLREFLEVPTKRPQKNV